jgi:hypothetical protein
VRTGRCGQGVRSKHAAAAEEDGVDWSGDVSKSKCSLRVVALRESPAVCYPARGIHRLGPVMTFALNNSSTNSMRPSHDDDTRARNVTGPGCGAQLTRTRTAQRA